MGWTLSPKFKRLPVYAVMLAWLGLSTEARAFELETPAPLPAAEFLTIEGAPTSLADFTGKIVVLNFWATWCAPCKREMPSLGRLATLFGRRSS